MRLNTFLTVTVVLVSMFYLAGCDKVSAIAGGPADGHDLEWYKAHYPEAKAEADYCIKKYQGPNSTREDLAKVPNFCSDAIRATKIYSQWAWNAAKCKMHQGDPRDVSCQFMASDAKQLDTSSKEAQELAEKIFAEAKKLGDGI